MKFLYCLLLCGLSGLSGVAIAAERIVSTNGALTEIVYALGAQQHLVGVDTTSTYPKVARQLPQVGYQRSLSLEGIASLSPDVVLVTQAAGPPLVLEQLEALGIKQLLLPDDYSVNGAFKRIRMLAETLDRTPQGQALIAQIQTDLAQLTQLKAQLAQRSPLKVLFLLTHVGNNRLAAGQQTVADAMIRLAGAQNAIQTYTGYKPLTAEAAVVLNPDVILTTATTAENEAVANKQNAQRIATLMQDPAFKPTTAVQQQRVKVFDGLYFLGFGPRFAQAARELTEYLLAQPT